MNVQAFHWSAHSFIMILGRLICTCEISSDNRPKTISKSRVVLYSIPHKMPSTLRRQGSGLGRLSERLSEVAVCKKSGAPISFCKPSKQNNKLAHVPSGNSGESVIKKTTYNYCQGLSTVPVPDNKNVGFHFPFLFANKNCNRFDRRSDANTKLGPCSKGLKSSTSPRRAESVEAHVARIGVETSAKCPSHARHGLAKNSRKRTR